MHMDVPIALGLAAGVAWSAISTFRGSGEVYYESLTMLIFLLLVGRWVQQRQQRSSYDAVEQLYALTPATARRLDAGSDGGPEQVREVPLEAVLPGDLVEVRAGESVPADGRVERGTSRLDLSLLTGESRPVGKVPGDLVHAGTVNLADRLVVRVTATGEATRVGRLMRLVERSAAERAPVVRLADRIAGWFVLVVLALATGTALAWWWIDPAQAMPNALSLLIVTCPCALGLATPLAIMAGIGQAARRGILVKGGEAVEALARSGTILFDKTGTLTRGEMAVVRWEGPDDLRPLVAAVEARSSHPVARALAAALGPPATIDAEVRETTGAGMAVDLGDGMLRVGSRRFLEDAGVAIPPSLERVESELVAAALSPVFVARRGRRRRGRSGRPAAGRRRRRRRGPPSRGLVRRPAVRRSPVRRRGRRAGRRHRSRGVHRQREPRAEARGRPERATAARSSWSATASTTPRPSRPRPSACRSEAAPRPASRWRTSSWPRTASAA